MSETEVIRGFKVFNPDWTCRNKNYTCPGTFEEDVDPSVCNRGMHFCKKAADCFDYYSFNPENKVAEVIAFTNRTVEKGNKCVTDYLEIVREISWQEVLEIVNTGTDCTGFRNSGDSNSGDWNSGNGNSGDWNSGDNNSGNWNSGDGNSGNGNSGNGNSGNRNSGNWNSGDDNSGNRNSGDDNSGDWNKCSFSNGCFNTVEPKIYLFNKPSDWTYMDWLNSGARYLLDQIPGDVLDNSECGSIWWRTLNDREKAIIKAIPNFDREIFREITGIDVEG